MNSGVTKTRTCRSHWKPSKGLQEKLLEAGTHNGASTELRRIHPEYSPVDGCLSRNAPYVHTAKRQLDAPTESDPLPAKKRARLARTDTERPGVDEKAEQADKTTVHQPKPKQPYASFLKDFTDPVHPHPVPDSLHTFVSEWIESIGSDREKRCRSDSHLYQSTHDPISRGLARSAPAMVYTRDADGFAVPPTPTSTGSRSHRTSSAGSVAPSDLTDATPGSSRPSGRRLVEDPLYRDMNLAANNIYMRHPCDPIPEQIPDLVDYVRHDRDSPGPSPDEVRQDRDLYDLSMGAGEPDVEKYFYAHVFPDPKSSDSLKRSDRQPMAKHTVPGGGSKTLKVSTPVPDMLYGYNRHAAFPQQQSQLISMGTEMIANNQGLVYPFFVIKFKGDGPSGAGSLWVATNQCLGASVSCVNIAERLNRQLRDCKSNVIQPVYSAAFSIAMSGTEARLYISWKNNELDHYMANIESFLLQKPEDYIEFRKCVRNIVDWGKEQRLQEIQDSLDCLLEESRKKASEEAKSRAPPSDSSTVSSKKHKSSSRNNSRRCDNAQDQTRAADEPYWGPDKTISQDVHGG